MNLTVDTGEHQKYRGGKIMVEKGVPKKDGSGQGTRENFNRGGCHDGEVCDVASMIKRNYREKVD